jgi:GNAT superfamily N-acetyltransferase
MIREAETKDIPRIVEMGTRSLLIGPYRDQVADNPEVTTRLAELFIENPQCKVLVSEEEGKITGLLAFVVFPHYYSGEITAGELMWYVEPEHRVGGIALRLLQEAETVARSMGAIRMQLTAPTEALGALYKHCGYHQLEVLYQRQL